MGSRLLAAAESLADQKPLNDLQIDLLAGCVGQGPAGEFVSWLNAANLPDPETLLANPSQFPKIEPGEEHMMYAILSNTMAILQNADMEPKERDKRWTQAWLVIHEACAYAPDVAFGGFVQPMLKLRPSHRAKTPKAVSERLIEYGQQVDVLPGKPKGDKT